MEIKKQLLAIFYGIALSLALSVLIHFLFSISFMYLIIDSGLSIFTLMILSFAFRFSAKSIKFEINKAYLFFATHLINSAIISFVWLSLIGFLIDLLMNLKVIDAEYVSSTYYMRYLGSSITYYVLVSYYYLVNYYKSYNDELLKSKELEGLVKEAELKNLKFQINPHFIFNSLNSIAALTSIDPDKARDMVVKLADFLRYTLSNNIKQMSTLQEEMKNIERYLMIEKVRFEEKFDYKFIVEESYFDYKLPNMLLQPLFENAIKYGVYESLEPAFIEMNVKKEGDYLSIRILNSIEGEGNNKNRGERVGLRNIQDRLKLIYNETNLMKIEQNDKQFNVIIKIPIKEENV